MLITFTLNGSPVSRDLDPARRLVNVLREDFRLTGTKEGCGEGECGACTILMDGEAVHACLVLAGQIEGREIVTIEGLAENGKLSIMPDAFVRHVAMQCGYCTPGMIMSAMGILLKNPDPTEEEVRTALSGNICRCTGYEQIIAAVFDAAKELREAKKI